MDTTPTLLDKLKIKLNLRSDYALAKFLNVTSVTLGRWRMGGSLSDENAIRVADLLQLPRAYVVACMHAQSATEDTESSGVWRQIADTFRERVTAWLAAIGLILFGILSGSHSASATDLTVNKYTLCEVRGATKRDRRRRFWPKIKAA